MTMYLLNTTITFRVSTVDIWVLIDDEIYMFKLFPCDEFVVTVGSKGAS